ncbi:MAG: CDP-alcohol phosphatidyltransferase family protein, partial [Candidatus Aenigmatarchaeota archaeon]
MLRLHFENFSRALSVKIGITFAHVPISPNKWTMISLLPAIGGVCFLLQRDLMWALGLFALAAAMDAIDGGVARVMGKATNYGAYLDGMTDRFVEAAMLFGLMIFGYPDWIAPGWMWLAGMLFFGTTMTTFSRAYADHRKVVTEKEQLDRMGGILERAERLILIFASMLVYFIQPMYATYAMALGVFLAALTVLQRMWAVRTL